VFESKSEVGLGNLLSRELKENFQNLHHKREIFFQRVFQNLWKRIESGVEVVKF